MGNGIPYIMNCCNKTDRNGKDIEINRINSKINSIKDFNFLYFYTHYLYLYNLKITN